jgi:hypothetical protein
VAPLRTADNGTIEAADIDIDSVGFGDLQIDGIEPTSCPNWPAAIGPQNYWSGWRLVLIRPFLFTKIPGLSSLLSRNYLLSRETLLVCSPSLPTKNLFFCLGEVVPMVWLLQVKADESRSGGKIETWCSMRTVHPLSLHETEDWIVNNIMFMFVVSFKFQISSIHAWDLIKESNNKYK